MPFNGHPIVPTRNISTFDYMPTRMEVAVSVGDMIDREFESQCMRFGIDYCVAIQAPLEFIAIAQKYKQRKK